jgi:hypothetical protein
VLVGAAQCVDLGPIGAGRNRVVLQLLGGLVASIAGLGVNGYGVHGV